MLSPKRTLAGSLAEKRTNKREAAVLQFAKQISACTWDFDVDGGAVGTISFGQSLPAGAIVTNIWTDEVTTVTGATDITLKAGSTALSGSIDFTGSSGVRARSMAVADAVKLTSASEINIEIATAAATAGKVTFYMEWMIVPNTVA
jgi:hypothetical protein